MLYKNLEKNVAESYIGDDIPEDLEEELASSYYNNFLEKTKISISYSYLISVATLVEKSIHILKSEGIELNKYKLIRDCKSLNIDTSPFVRNFDKKLEDFWNLRNLIAHCSGAYKYIKSTSKKSLSTISKKDYGIELLDHSILIPKDFIDNICNEFIKLFSKI